VSSTDIAGLSVTFQTDTIISWTPEPGGALECQSHAVTDGTRTWVIDPIDTPGIDELLKALPPIADVIVLLDRHLRDSYAVGKRYGVVPLVPKGTRTPKGEPARPYDRDLAGTPFDVLQVPAHIPRWRERALWWPEEATLIVADCLGSADYYLAGDDRLAVHPLMRHLPPRDLRAVEPTTICVGHGPAITEDATAALTAALHTSRRRLPQYALATVGRLGHLSKFPRRGC
jgi:hypothetical protein